VAKIAKKACAIAEFSHRGMAWEISVIGMGKLVKFGA
jgi:hypothetical protein